MNSILCTLALALFPMSAHSPTHPPRELAARCLWAERGWRSEALAVEQHGESGAIAAGLAALAEHRRLHGWGALEEGRTSWMVSRAAACPPAALGEFARRELSPASGELVRVYRELAQVLARNRVTEGSLRFLDAARGGSEHGARLEDARAVLLRDRVRVLVAAEEWERALEGLAALDEIASADATATRDAPPTPDGRARVESTVSPRREETAFLRAHCLLELGRMQELEELCAAHITAGGAVEPSCRWIELLLEGWERVGMPQHPQSLLEALLVRFAGRPSLGARIVQLDASWEVALRHRHLLAMDEHYASSHLVDLLDAGDHRQDVLERIARSGPESLDALIAAARTMPRDDPREHRLQDVLAATGEARVLPILEARFPVREEIAARLCMESWRSANALRRDLASTR